MKKLVLLVMCCFLLTGCFQTQRAQKDSTTEETAQNQSEKMTLPQYSISDKYYKTVLPFEPSASRGLIIENVNSRTDLNEFETGLMRISQEAFPTDSYFFKEGGELDAETVRAWVKRKYTPAQLKDLKMKAEDNLGLNPILPDKGNVQTNNEKNPLYLAHILEQDYLVRVSSKKVKLGGMSIGLALNSVHYYKETKDGEEFKSDLESKTVIAEGKKIANEILARLRKEKATKNIPITFALYLQKPKGSVIPGNFVAKATAGSGDNSIGKWTKINEAYYLFPSKTANTDYRGDSSAFMKFKSDLEEYFPNFTGVSARAFYVNGNLQELKISIPMQFYGETEVIGFTQYTAGLVRGAFSKDVKVEVNISSVNGAEALIVRSPDKEEPYVYIYD